MAEVNTPHLKFTHTKYTRANEIWMIRWLMVHGDPGLASHPQLRNYFLADSDLFGVSGIYTEGSLSSLPVALVFWSVDKDKSFIHHIAYAAGVKIADGQVLDAAFHMLMRPRCQVFVRSFDEVNPQYWDQDLMVRAGDVVEHSAYEGVFSRTAPRFDGFVFERRINASTSV